MDESKRDALYVTDFALGGLLCCMLDTDALTASQSPLALLSL